MPDKPAQEGLAKRAQTGGTGEGAGGNQPSLKWDDSGMTTSYANVVNVSMTREEVGLFFGTNLTSGIGNRSELTIRLSDRIIMTPFAAKRLALLLNTHLKAYEDRYGPLEIEGARQSQS